MYDNFLCRMDSLTNFASSKNMIDLFHKTNPNISNIWFD